MHRFESNHLPPILICHPSKVGLASERVGFGCDGRVGPDRPVESTTQCPGGALCGHVPRFGPLLAPRRLEREEPWGKPSRMLGANPACSPNQVNSADWKDISSKALPLNSHSPVTLTVRSITPGAASGRFIAKSTSTRNESGMLPSANLLVRNVFTS